jgi:seryl-tRNA synthetase
MLDIKFIREESEAVKAGLKARNFKDGDASVQRVLDIDRERRETITLKESLQNKAKGLSEQIGGLMRSGQKEQAEQLRNQANDMKTEIQELATKVDGLDEEQNRIVLTFPNIPHASVPYGQSADDNFVAAEHGHIPILPGWSKPHWEIAADLDIIDFELGAKITGSGFPVYKGQGAKFLRALIQFFLDEAEDAGYIEMVPPLVVNKDSGYGTGQLPDKDGQMYYIPLDDLYLIPTAEVPVTNLYRDVILEESQLPIQNCGYTQCFRREAGAYGAHVRGLNRLHQFDKVEIVEIVHPDQSYERLEKMLLHARGLLEKLELPYRVLLLCSGDMGFTSAKTYDLEVYSAGQSRWLEVSSVSNFENFQSRRLKLRYRDAVKGNVLAHTLNGSALALPRIMAALLENNQQEDGSVILPKALHKYLRFERLTKS